MTSTDDGGSGPSEHGTTEPEVPEAGLIGDDDLPEDLRPTDDNPLAQDPGEGADDNSDRSETPKVEGMPDMGDPGA